MDFVRNLFKGDKYIWGIFFMLCIISGIEMFSASSTLAYKAAEHYNPIFAHLTQLIFGAILTIMLLNMPPHYFRGLGYLLYPFAFLLLVGVMFTPEVNGASRHIFGFQPSEFAKFATISVVCALLAKGQTEDGITKNSFYGILIASGLVLLFIALENMSTAILLGSVIFCLMYIAHVQTKRLLAIVGAGVILIALGLTLLFTLPNSMLKGRSLTWKNRMVEQPAEKDVSKVEQAINDKNRQVQYGHMAVANGGIIGKGPGNSQIRDFLPQAYSDFIYSIIIEEGGLVGGGVVLFLYIALIVRAGIIFRRCTKSFPGLLLLGVTMLIVFQALINMAVGVDLIPVTGQPLPLISRGGTSILLNCVYFGIILSVSRSVGTDEDALQPIYIGEEDNVIKGLSEIQEEFQPTYSEETTIEEQKTIQEKEKYPY